VRQRFDWDVGGHDYNSVLGECLWQERGCASVGWRRTIVLLLTVWLGGLLLATALCWLAVWRSQNLVG